MTKRTLEALETIIDEMQYLVEHPRIQQKTWVAKGKTWLPTLHHAKEDLEKLQQPHDFATEAYQSLIAVFEQIGLSIQKRDTTSWGYSWHDEPLKGAFSSVSQAVESALKERIK